METFLGMEVQQNLEQHVHQAPPGSLHPRNVGKVQEVHQEDSLHQACSNLSRHNPVELGMSRNRRQRSCSQASNQHARITVEVLHQVVLDDVQNLARCYIVKEMSNRIHDAANWSLAITFACAEFRFGNSISPGNLMLNNKATIV
jgi:hypothetical protein